MSCWLWRLANSLGLLSLFLDSHDCRASTVERQPSAVNTEINRPMLSQMSFKTFYPWLFHMAVELVFRIDLSAIERRHLWKPDGRCRPSRPDVHENNPRKQIHARPRWWREHSVVLTRLGVKPGYVTSAWLGRHGKDTPVKAWVRTLETTSVARVRCRLDWAGRQAR